MKYHGSTIKVACLQGLELRIQVRQVIGFVLALVLSQAALAQAPASATPVPAVLFTRTPDSVQQATPTVTLTFSPSPLPSARLQALASAGNVNVRQFPDIESEILGTIASGTEYPALRKYYRWYELRYDLSPTGFAWVFGDLIQISGDATLIDGVDDLDISVIVNQSLDLLTTAAAAEESDRAVQVATNRPDHLQRAALAVATRLPTFTPPAPTRAPLTAQAVQETEEAGTLPNLPPIVPIVALGGLGAIGLLVSLLRR